MKIPVAWITSVSSPTATAPSLHARAATLLPRSTALFLLIGSESFHVLAMALGQSVGTCRAGSSGTGWWWPWLDL